MADVNIPYGEAGMAGFVQGDNFSSQELFSGGQPVPSTIDHSVESGVELPAFSVVGKVGGYLVMATEDDAPADSARAVLTFSGNAVADETVTVAGRVYTWKAATPSDDEILVGGSAAASAANLIAAVNGTGTPGTETGEDTVIHETVDARQGATTSIVEFVASDGGQAGNAYASTETMTNAAFGSATFTGGRDATGVAPQFITTAPCTDVGADQSVAVFHQGCFNPAALNWHSSFDDDAKKKAAFDGAPSPTNILIRKIL